MELFFTGIAVGILLALPLVFYTSRRTARRVLKLEKKAQSAERLAEQVMLTGGLAHEIKNPLSTIGLNLQLVGEMITDLNLDPAVARRLSTRIESLSREASRLKGILEDFLSFAGGVRLDRHPADINSIIEEMVDFYSPQAEASGVHLRSSLDPAAGKVHLDKTIFKQALLNLMINATQAMVEARYSDKPHGGATDLILRTQPSADGSGVDVHVTDLGPGIDEAMLKEIFRPYFTTKRGGTGLGLPTTRRIIEEHGGTIMVHSEPGRGSDFILHLPYEPGNLPPEEAGRP